MSIIVTGNEFVEVFLCVFVTNFSSNGLFEGESSSSMNMKIFRSITKVCMKNQDSEKEKVHLLGRN